MNETTNFAVEQANEPTGEIVSTTEKTPTEAEFLPKPYTFRKLAAEDVFPMFAILSKIGLKEFKSFFEGDEFKNTVSAFTGKADDDKAVTSLGVSIVFEIATVIIGNLPKCENDIFNMLSSTSNLSVEEVRGLGLADFTEMVIDFVKKEEFKDFIKVVSKLFK